MSGLIPQTRSLAAALGIDTKTAPSLVDKSKWTLIENAHFTKGAAGELSKRNGYTEMPNVDINGNAITNGQSLISFGTEQDLIANASFYSYAASQDAWLNRGSILNIVPTETTIVDNSYIQSNCDSATFASGTIVVTTYVWEDTRGGVWYKLIDETTGSVLLADTQFLTTGLYPRVLVANNSNFPVIFCSSSAGGIYAATVNPFTPTSVLTPTEIVSSTAASTPLEVYPNSTTANFAIAYENANGYLTLANVNSSLGVSNTTVYGTTTPVSCITMCNSSAAAGLVVGWVTTASSGTLYTIVVVQDGVNTVVTALVTTVVGGAVENMISFPVNTGTRIVLQEAPAGVNDRRIFTTLLSGATPGSFTSVMRGMAICSTPLTVNGNVYFLANFPSSVQQTYFLISATNFVVSGRFMYSNAGPFPTHRLANWNNPTGAVWTLALTQANVFLTSAGGIAQDLYGVSKLAIDFGQTAVRSEQLGRDLALCGALPRIYDGVNLVEAGFNQYPEEMVAAGLSSNCAITNIVRNSNGFFTSYTLSMPVNPVNPGSDGVMLVPGDYFFPAVGGYGFYWNVDNKTPSHPTTGPSTGVTWEAIAVNGSDSAATIATKTAAVISPLVSGYQSLTVVGNQINVTCSTPAVVFLRTQFEIAQTAVGTGSAAGQINFNCLPGFMIQPGQYFYFQTYNHTTLQNGYIWFTVNGIGTDPNPFNANWVSCNVSILSTDTESSVATKVAAAANALTALYVTASATQSGVSIVNGYVGAISAYAQPGTVGLNALGLTTSSSAAYQWVAVYEWVDNVGQLHRSAPSVPVSLGVGGQGLQNGVVQLTVKTLRLSYRKNVDIAIYRTAGNGTVFQRVTSAINLLYNNAAVDTLTFVDNVSDTSLASGELLYTTGGVVQNDQAPAMTQVHSHLDRLWGSGLEDPQLIWWSKFFASGVAVEWSAEQTTRIDAGAGPVLRLMTMDSNLIVFCANQIWLIAGAGPTAANQGVPFSPPAQITSPVSIRDPQSAVLIPQGIVFKSAKGFYLLDRSLNVSQLPINGTAVEAYVADVVVAATLIPQSTEIRFLSASGTTQLLDYQFMQWAPFTNHQGVDAAVFEGTYFYLLANGAVFEEAPGVYLDNSTPITMFLQTAWIKSVEDQNGEQVQAFARVWQTLIKGYFPTGCKMQVTLAVNYLPTIVDTQVFDPNGVSAPVYQLRFKHLIQKCESFQLTIQDTNPDPTGATTYSLDALDFEVGVKKGAYKSLPPGQTI